MARQRNESSDPSPKEYMLPPIRIRPSRFSGLGVTVRRIPAPKMPKQFTKSATTTASSTPAGRIDTSNGAYETKSTRVITAQYEILPELEAEEDAHFFSSMTTSLERDSCEQVRDEKLLEDLDWSQFEEQVIPCQGSHQAGETEILLDL